MAHAPQPLRTALIRLAHSMPKGDDRQAVLGVLAANTPEQTTAMLQDKIRGATALHDQLKAVDYGDYNISDFWASELPKARKLSDRIMKQKKALETTLYSFIREAKRSL